MLLSICKTVLLHRMLSLQLCCLTCSYAAKAAASFQTDMLNPSNGANTTVSATCQDMCGIGYHIYFLGWLLLQDYNNIDNSMLELVFAPAAAWISRSDEDIIAGM